MPTSLARPSPTPLDRTRAILTAVASRPDAAAVNRDPPAAPTVQLDPTSDTGVSSTDGITNINTPLLRGTADPYAVIQIVLESQVIATTTTLEDGTWSVEVPALPDGESTLTARVELDNDGTDDGFVDSAPLSLVVDTQPPEVLTSQFFYQTSPHTLRISFTERVGQTLEPADLSVTNVTTETVISSELMSLGFSPINKVATITFPPLPGSILPDGNYELRIDHANVTDVAGNALLVTSAFEFFYLTGDTNHDRLVNQIDMDAVSAHFGQVQFGIASGDVNYDGVVDLSDFFIVAERFGTELPPPPAPVLALQAAADRGERVRGGFSTRSIRDSIL